MLIHTEENLEFDTIRNEVSKFALTEIGKNACQKLTYYNDINIVKEKLDLTEEMIFLYKNYQLPTINVRNINPYLKNAKIPGSMLNAEELILIAYCLRSFRNLKHFIKENENVFPKIHEVVKNIGIFTPVEEKITHSISDDFKIMDNASKELKSIRSEKQIIEDRIERKLKSYIYNQNNKRFIQDTVIVKRQNRFSIPIKTDHKGHVKGIVLDSSSSGETIFVEIENVVEDNNKLLTLINKELEEERRILKELTKLITEKNEEIYQSLKEFVKFDLIYAKARYSISKKAIRPEINENGIFDIKNAIHPLLKGEVVPIDIILGEEYTVLILTGPNTGGKTVSLKTIGLLTLMTMSGIFITAKEGSKISIVDNVFVDIGDEQSIVQNLSTFSGHIKRVIKIFKMATEKSLILIDELGAGTDPKEGSALGVAVIKKLIGIKSKTMITTHFSDIKNTALVMKDVESASCDFDIKTLRPTYRLIYGITGKSNAIVIAKRLGLNDDIVDAAKEIVEKNKTGEDELYENLSLQKEKYLKLFNKYQRKEKFLNEKLNVINEKEVLLNKKENELNKIKRKEYKDLLKEYKTKLEDLLKRHEKELKNKSEIKKDLSDINNKIKNIEKDDTKNKRDIIKIKKVKIEKLKIGDKVRIIGLEKTGKICDINLKKENITVQIGDIKFTTSITDIELIDDIGISENKTNIKYPYSENVSDIDYKTNINESAPFEINLIGKRGEEAISETTDYIEKLYMSGREFGRIIHGKGKGILRTLIEDLLKQHPYVTNYNFARPEMGGYGVTEIKIKN